MAVLGNEYKAQFLLEFHCSVLCGMSGVGRVQEGSKCGLKPKGYPQALAHELSTSRRFKVISKGHRSEIETLMSWDGGSYKAHQLLKGVSPSFPLAHWCPEGKCCRTTPSSHLRKLARNEFLHELSQLFVLKENSVAE